MKLLKFGDTVINIDRAIRIDDSGSYISIDFVPADNALLPLNIRLEGPEAAALRKWLTLNAEDMAGFGPASTGEPLGPKTPSSSAR